MYSINDVWPRRARVVRYTQVHPGNKRLRCCAFRSTAVVELVSRDLMIRPPANIKRDSFEAVWQSELLPLLVTNPHLSGTTLFEENSTRRRPRVPLLHHRSRRIGHADFALSVPSKLESFTNSLRRRRMRPSARSMTRPCSSAQTSKASSVTVVVEETAETAWRKRSKATSAAFSRALPGLASGTKREANINR